VRWVAVNVAVKQVFSTWALRQASPNISQTVALHILEWLQSLVKRLEGDMGAVIPLQARGRCGQGRDDAEKWAHNIPAGMPRHLCGASWGPEDG